MYAIMKGMGFSGVHIGGHSLKYEQVEEILDRGEALLPNWQDLVRHFDAPQPGGFYLYEPDPKTGLNSETPIERQGRKPALQIGLSYRNARFFHKILFEPDRNLFGPMRHLCSRIAGTRLEGPFHKLEHLAKVLLFDCKDCGDCALTDVAYCCPMSHCPKHQRNGACGGSRDGWCEVHPGVRRCIWVIAYDRLKHYGEETCLDGGTVPPCNWDFHQTSSWINFFLGRDHTARRLGIAAVEKKGAPPC